MQPHNIHAMHNNNSNKNKNLNNHKRNTNNTTTAVIPPPRSHSSTTQACAACKYQRRKCTPDCVLAPYFPHDRQRQFLNAHRLFGVSNIVKIVKHLQPPAKDHAMRTIIFQSDARAADPIGGCYRIIRDLEQRINIAKAELDIVLHHLAVFRAAHQNQQQQPLAEVRESTISWDPLESYNEKWRGTFGAGGEEEVVDDLNSWGCLNGDENGHVHGGSAESTSSSLAINHVRGISFEECNASLDQLSCDDVVGVQI